MFNAIGGGFNNFSGGIQSFGGGQMNPQKMMRMRQMVSQRREQGLPTPFADKLQANFQNGYSPANGALCNCRSMNAGMSPGAHLSQDQRSEIREHIQNARADGQVTHEERQALMDKLQGFRQDSGGLCNSCHGGGGSPLAMIANRFGGGY